LILPLVEKNLEKILCRPELHFKELVRKNNAMSLVFMAFYFEKIGPFSFLPN